MNARSNKRGLAELTRRTVAGEVEWRFVEPNSFSLADADREIYLAPTITGLLLGVRHRNRELITPSMYGDILHPEELRSLIQLYQAILTKLRAGLYARLGQ